MENTSTRRPAPGIPRLPTIIQLGGALIALLGGRVVALPLVALIDVLVDDGHTGFGRVRYVAADGAVAVHFGCDPLTHVWEFPAARVRPVRGGIALTALRGYLATNPEIAADLDAIENADDRIHVEAA